MEIYLLKSLACLAILLLFYKLLLEKENMHVFKRFYLLSSVVAAILIPLITFTTYVESSSEVLNPFIYSSESTAEVSKPINYLPHVLIGIYFLGVLFFSIKFFRNLRSLIMKIQNNPKVKLNSITNVLLSEKTPPHTFFNFIFFNKDKYLHNQIPEDVKIHEEAHARQKHSYDVLFVELLQIIFWINPLIFLLKKAIKLNHEFLADRAVIQKGINTAEYQHTLLSFSSGHLQSDLVNPINYSSIKKRFTVMKTKTSKKTIWERSLLLLPLLAGLLYGFSTKEVVVQENNKRIQQEPNRNQEQISKEKKREKATPAMLQEYNLLVIRANEERMLKTVEAKRILEIERLMTSEQKENVVQRQYEIIESFSEQQEKATPEMVAEYNDLAKKYNDKPENGNFIPKKDYERMKYIYSLMTAEQKEKSEAFPTPSPPPPPNEKLVAEYNKLAKHFNSLPEGTEVSERKDFKRMLWIYQIMSSEQKGKAEELPYHLIPPPPPPPGPEPAEVVGYPTPRAPEARDSKKMEVPPPPPAPAVEDLPPPPPPVEVIGYPTPQPPPPPPSPEEAIKEWMDEDANFFYNGKAISGKEALEIVQEKGGKNLNVQI